MDPTDPTASGSRSAAALKAIISWTFAAVNARGEFPKIDPSTVLDSTTLRRVGKVVAVYSAKPLVGGAVVLLELFARLILLLIFLALSFSPPRRTVMVEKMRIKFEAHVNSVRRCACSWLGVLDASLARFCSPTNIRRTPRWSAPSKPCMQTPAPRAESSSGGACVHRLGMLSTKPSSPGKSHLPADARLLIVGSSGVGKSSITSALQRYARKSGIEQLPVAEAHGPRLPDLAALGDGLELVLVVWEAGQGTPLPAYAARYAAQIQQQTESLQSRPRGRGGSEPQLAEGGDGVGAPASEGASPRGGALRRRANGSKEEGRAGSSSDEDATASAPSSGGAYRAPRMLVVCNKCDMMPCPMPQIRGLAPSQAFIAVSAERGTNLAHLWGMVHPVLSPDARPPRSASPLRAASPSGLSRVGAAVAARPALANDALPTQ